MVTASITTNDDHKYKQRLIEFVEFRQICWIQLELEKKKSMRLHNNSYYCLLDWIQSTISAILLGIYGQLIKTIMESNQ